MLSNVLRPSRISVNTERQEDTVRRGLWGRTGKHAVFLPDFVWSYLRVVSYYCYLRRFPVILWREIVFCPPVLWERTQSVFLLEPKTRKWKPRSHSETKVRVIGIRWNIWVSAMKLPPISVSTTHSHTLPCVESEEVPWRLYWISGWESHHPSNSSLDCSNVWLSLHPRFEHIVDS